MARFVLLVAATLLCLGLTSGVVISTPTSSTSAAEKYWTKTLPNTLMPDLIRAFLSTSTPRPSVDAAKANVHTDSANIEGFFDSKYNSAYGSENAKANVHTNSANIEGFFDSKYNSAYGSENADQLNHYYDPSLTIYFKEETLRPGQKVSLGFTMSSKKGLVNPFLSQKDSESFPLPTSSKLNGVYNYLFGTNPSPTETSVMKETLQICEIQPLEGETRYCATTLESMIDFATTQLRTKEVRVLTTVFKNVPKSKELAKKQQYTIQLVGLEKIKSPPGTVVCHNHPYAHAVFLCHHLAATRTYRVPLKGQDGAHVDAVVVCHTDTSKWNPNHLAFKVMLGVKPGTVPICHFLAEETVTWVHA